MNPGAILETMAELRQAYNLAKLYDEDFFDWTQRTAELIREGRLHDLDWEHLAEEIEDMGKRDRRELQSRLTILVAHLLKYRFQPGKRGPSWNRTIGEQRRELQLVLRQSPSLRQWIAIDLGDIYESALYDAVNETGLPSGFPSECPFTVDQILSREFLPEEA